VSEGNSEELKPCNKCRKEKPLSEFHQHPRNKDGRQYSCKECVSQYKAGYYVRNVDKIRRYRTENREAVLLATKRSRVSREYDLSLEEAESLWFAESCGICGTTDRGSRGKFFIDHCHKTGKVRGALCHGCNSGIGHFLDNPTFLRAAADYLEEAKK
jgi:hypothetical protein